MDEQPRGRRGAGSEMDNSVIVLRLVLTPTKGDAAMTSCLLALATSEVAVLKRTHNRGVCVHTQQNMHTPTL